MSNADSDSEVNDLFEDFDDYAGAFAQYLLGQIDLPSFFLKEDDDGVIVSDLWDAQFDLPDEFYLFQTLDVDGTDSIPSI